MRGKVKWFNNEKGFGFIEYHNESIFVHYSALVMDDYNAIKEGQVVEFELFKTMEKLKNKKYSDIFSKVMQFNVNGQLINVKILKYLKGKFIQNEENFKALTLTLSALSIIIPIIFAGDSKNDNAPAKVEINCGNKCTIIINESDNNKTLEDIFGSNKE